MKTALLVVNSEKSVLAVTENVRLNEEITILVEEMIKNEAIGFVHLVETIILLSELNAIVVGNQSEVTFRNVTALSETIVADVEMTVADVAMIVVEEVVTTEDLVIKNNIIEMIGFVLHVRMTISLSELNATNVESLDREETLEEEIPVVATEEVATAADAMVDVVATEEVATVADATVDVVATEEVALAADETVIVEDVEATEEVASAADETVIVEDVEAIDKVALAADETVIVEATEEVVPAADEMVTVEDVEMTKTVVEEMTVQMNNIERLVENDQVMLTIDHLKKSSLVDINEAMTMTIKVKI